MRRFAPEASIETIVEVEVPGLCARNGSAAETLALKLDPLEPTIAVPYATEAGRFQTAGVPTDRVRPRLDRPGAPAGRVH